MAKNGSVQDDTMITDAEKEANDEPSDKEPKQKDDGPAEMEQVVVSLDACSFSWPLLVYKIVPINNHVYKWWFC